MWLINKTFKTDPKDVDRSDVRWIDEHGYPETTKGEETAAEARRSPMEVEGEQAVIEANGRTWTAMRADLQEIRAEVAVRVQPPDEESEESGEEEGGGWRRNLKEGTGYRASS